MVAVTSRARRWACLLILPLLIPVAQQLIARPGLPSGGYEFNFVLPPKYFEYFPVDGFANQTIFQYSLTSSAAVSVAFMTSAQFSSFNSTSAGISDSITYHNGTSVKETLREGRGDYDIVIYAFEAKANITFTYVLYPNNPLSSGPLYPPEPTGIASFGLTNKSGVDSPYAVRSTDVVGLAAVSALRAFNSSAGSVGANPSGVTIQLNSELVVNEGKSSQVYWCQNTPDFVTSASQVAMSDNVWNSSASGVLSNESITSEGGGGTVYTYQQNGETQYYYSFEGSNTTYSLPFEITLLVNATAEPGTGVLVQFGARLADSGASRENFWFDNVTIHDPAVESSYFLTAGNYTTPDGSFYDTELVFAGEGNGEATSFSQMASSLGLYYANGTVSTLTPFPSYFSFGQATQESADNLRVAYLGDGEASVSVGTPDYMYLGTASGSLPSAAIAKALLADVGGAASASTTASSSSSTSSTPSSSTALASVPEFPPQLAFASISVVLIVAAYMLVRREKDHRPT